MSLVCGYVLICTITIPRNAHLTLSLHDALPIYNGTFNLKIDGALVKENASNGDASAFVNVSNGTHLVSEANGTSSPDGQSACVSSSHCNNAGGANSPASGQSLTTSALGYGDVVT